MENLELAVQNTVSYQSLQERIIFDAKFFIETFISITDKDRNVIPFIFNPAQVVYYDNRTNRDIILKPRQLGFCHDVKTKILTENLEWVPIGDIETGQRIIAVDEFPENGKGKSRKFKTAIVENKWSIIAPAFRLTFDDGRILTATGGHRYLHKRKHSSPRLIWKEVKDLKVGDEIRYITKLWNEKNYEDGWFGGMLDGEGSLRFLNHSGVELSVSQGFGPVFNRLKKYADSHNYHYRIDIDDRKNDEGSSKFGNNPVAKLVFARQDEIFKLLGQTRPERFIGIPWWENKELPNEGYAKIVSIESIPAQEMIDLQTSEKTFIAEGFVSHNSTVIMALFLHDTMFVPNTVSVIIAHTTEAAATLFERVKFMFYSLPPYLQPHVKYSNRKELTFDKINSTFFIGSAEAQDFGRGKTINNLHCSEAAAPAWDEDFLVGLLEAVPKSGRIVLESTAQGEGNIYHRFYVNAREGANEYKNHYFRWFDHSEYKSLVTTSEPMHYNEEEENLRKHCHVTDEQIKWRREKQGVLGAKFIQEYPEESDDDAFLKSGSPVFDVIKLRDRDRELPEQYPAEIWLGGDLFIYKIVEPGGVYIIGCDTSEGDINSDFSAAMVIRVRPLPMEQVALLRGRWTPDMFSEKVHRIGIAYNKALLAVERNNHGHAVLLNLGNGIVRQNKIKYPPYPNLYYGPDKKPGWHTTPLTKPQMVQELDRALRADEILLNSKLFLEEARKFVFLTGNKVGAQKSAHDDIVMAQSIAIIAAETAGDFSWSFI